jgi:hypothetical protein
VLCGLLEMSVGDIVFVPRNPDDGHFMVATVKGLYAFDHATVVEVADVRNDCRHLRRRSIESNACGFCAELGQVKRTSRTSPG